MDRTVIIACRTVADELTMAVRETACPHPILWIESGLHMNPDSLRKRLQDEIDHVGNIEQALLAFGYCGNALLGLRAPGFRLVFPRVDDCITLMLGSSERRADLARESGTYFLTKGWLDYERNIWVEYQASVKRYGKEKAARIYQTMLRHYQRLAVIDTGAYDAAAVLERAADIGSELGLTPCMIGGTIRYIKKLLTGPWDRDFIVIPPGETITIKHIYKGDGLADAPPAASAMTP
ncbi:MAG: DUF1638 domain-containing protein [Syntrophorhabdales bacterium]|jgi:hypothetical protein